MPTEWYYNRAGHEHGPISSSELKRLAATGEIAPTDCVRRKDMDGWTPAAKVKGLFPEPATATPVAGPSSPPPLPNEREQAASLQSEENNTSTVQRNSFPTKLKGWFSELASSTKAAGKLVALQAERTKLEKVTLPAAHRELGQHIYAHGQFQDEFLEQFQSIDNLERKLEEIGASVAPAAETHGDGGKAKALAGSARAAADKKLLEQKRGQAFAALGKAAFEKHRQQAGPEEIVEKVSDHRSRLKTLDAEIAELTHAGQGRVVTPKRIAIGGVVLVAVCVLFLAKSVLLPGGYSAEALWAMSEKEADALEGKWITVRGEVTNARYFPDGNPFLLLQENKSLIVMGDEDAPQVSFEFDGSESHGVEIESLSRGDWITVKGKVYLGGEGVVALRLCELVGGPSKSNESSPATAKGTPKSVQQMSYEEFIYALAALFGTQEWTYYHIHSTEPGEFGDPYTQYQFKRGKRQEIPLNEFLASLGEPSFKYGDWSEETWIYRCRDGEVTLKIQNYSELPEGNQQRRDAVMPLAGTKIPGHHSF